MLILKLRSGEALIVNPDSPDATRLRVCWSRRGEVRLEVEGPARVLRQRAREVRPTCHIGGCEHNVGGPCSGFQYMAGCPYDPPEREPDDLD